MKMAIPVFNGRVAPVFDWAGKVVVVEFERMNELRRQEISMSCIPAAARPHHLRAMGVSVLICGGISTHLQGLTEHCGIRVFPWLVGDYQQVLRDFIYRDCAPLADSTAVPPQDANGAETPSTTKPRSKPCRTRK
jgi:predicted Fe-Mo cluster-binding NifX family protein